jgi:hypothetical protein
MLNWASHIFNSVVYGCWIMWFLFSLLLVIMGFGSSFLGVILCWCLFFSVVCSSIICWYVMFLCSLLYCVIGHFSPYFARFCRPGDMYCSFSMTSGIFMTHCTAVTQSMVPESLWGFTSVAYSHEALLPRGLSGTDLRVTTVHYIW